MAAGPGTAAQNSEWMVTESCQLVESKVHCRLSPEEMREIQFQALERLSRSHDPLLRHVLEVKVVCNQRRNFINFMVRKEYVTLCHVDHSGPVHFCYFVSDKLEPYVIVTAVHSEQGRLVQLSRGLVEELVKSLAAFKQRHGVANESYHYTPLNERNETEQFVRSGGASQQNKAHSGHWHLKMRVATGMVTHLLPVYQLVNLQSLKETVEPVKYNFSRENLTWEACHELLISDASP